MNFTVAVDRLVLSDPISGQTWIMDQVSRGSTYYALLGWIRGSLGHTCPYCKRLYCLQIERKDLITMIRCTNCSQGGARVVVAGQPAKYYAVSHNIPITRQWPTRNSVTLGEVNNSIVIKGIPDALYAVLAVPNMFWSPIKEFSEVVSASGRRGMLRLESIGQWIFTGRGASEYDNDESGITRHVGESYHYLQFMLDGSILSELLPIAYQVIHPSAILRRNISRVLGSEHILNPYKYIFRALTEPGFLGGRIQTLSLDPDFQISPVAANVLERAFYSDPYIQSSLAQNHNNTDLQLLQQSKITELFGSKYASRLIK